MDAVCLALVCAFLESPRSEPATGWAHNTNFVVLAPSQGLADQILKTAEVARKEIALDLIGEELPAGVGRVSLSINVSDNEDSGQSWLMDKPGRRFHLVWVTTTEDRIAAGVRHELSHCIVATQFGTSLPAFANEALACLQDDPQRIALRRRTLELMARTGNWPSLQSMLAAEHIEDTDHAGYTAAASVAQFLTSKSNKSTFITFARDGAKTGWESALKKYYAIENVTELQSRWEAWVKAAANSTSDAKKPARAEGRVKANQRG